jgi:hypothetical protein
MTRFQEMKRDYRDGMVLNVIAAPSLVEAGRGRLLSPSIPQAQFDAMAKAMTTPNPKGRVVKPIKLEITAALTGPLAEGERAIDVQVRA